MRRALLVGGAVTGGFMAVFVVVGGVTKLVHVAGWSANAKYVTGIAGVVFVVLGIAMLFGFKPPLRHAGAVAVGERDTHRALDVRLRRRLRRRCR